MTITERVAWALWLSETWHSPWRNRDFYIKAGISKSSMLHYKARGIVVFDRMLTGRHGI